MQVPLFLVTLVATVLGILLSVQSGRAGNRPAHYWRVGFTVLMLAAAIIQAEILGHDWDFPKSRLDLHLFCAFAALASLPGAAWSGWRLRRDPMMRTVHCRWVGAFIALTVSAVVTAGWMFLAATPAA